MEIAGKVAFVTGAASGIGQATALALARAGAAVVAADIDEAGAHATARAIEEAGGAASSVRVDVSAGAEVDAAVAFAEQTHGGIDIVFNNAGIIVPTRPFDEADRAAWTRMVSINFTGVLLCAQAALGALRRRGGGAMVITSSIAGVIAYPGNPIYAATKSGVLGFTRSLAPLREEANIRVNCICPELVDTPLVWGAVGVPRPSDGLLRGAPMMPPSHIAGVVLDLIRDDSLAGQAIQVSPNRPPTPVPFPDIGVTR